MRRTIVLTHTDLDTIEDGGTVTASTPDATFMFTDEANWSGPAFSGGVHRVGLDRHRLTDLRNGLPRMVLPIGSDESVILTTDVIEAAKR